MTGPTSGSAERVEDEGVYSIVRMIDFLLLYLKSRNWAAA